MKDRASFIGSIAGRAMLREVCTTPKPGLVDRCGSGSHDDMDLALFMDSTASLIPYMCECAQIGVEAPEEGEPRDILSSLRKVGIRGESAMFHATGGINTQKGLMFSLGLLCAAAGYNSVHCERVQAEALCRWGSMIVSGIVERELEGLRLSDFKSFGKNEISSGESLFLSHGVPGIRGEAERGFPVALNRGLPALRTSLSQGMSLNDAMVMALLEMMTITEDTNVIKRSGLDGLKICRDMSRKAFLLGGVSSEEGRSYLVEMGRVFEQRRISPGGAADLLAVSEFLRICEDSL